MLIRTPHIFFLLFLCLVQSSFGQETDKQLEAALRAVGDQMLTDLGDSSSRVLPIEKEGDTYRISFEKDMELEPGLLVSQIESSFQNNKLSTHYIVEVVACESQEVVYSYEMNLLQQTDLIPCRSRLLPLDCYQVLFTVMDAPVMIDDDGESTSSWWLYMVVGLLFLAVLYLLFVRKSKPKKRDPNLIPLGRFAFDTRNSQLVLEDYRVELSSKEADLLLLLHQQANTQVEREVILNKVWGDEGDYVGRTLDVFISKLRKKLEPDPGVRIKNIRGVGYKLVLNDPV